MTQRAQDLEELSRLVAEVRPQLHRYCARMVGSVFDGEDVLQEALTKAAEALPSAGNLESAERWLFTIAHNTALDALRRRKRRIEISLEEDSPELPSAVPDADLWVASTASLTRLMQLPVLQRATVVLTDVLEYSLSEVVDILMTTLPAAKAALYRGRVRLKSLADAEEALSPALNVEEQARLRSYADSFNARDFAALRELLAEDVRLDLVNRRTLAGRKDVSVYFTRYSETAGWKFTAGLAEGRPALLVRDSGNSTAAVDYVVLLEWRDGRIAGIRDFHYARYIVDGLAIARF